MKPRIFSLIVLGLLACAPAARADFVVNGSFESPQITGLFNTYPAGSTAITGWTVINGANNTAGSGSVDLLHSFAAAHSGTQSVDLDGTSSPDPTGGLTQTLTGLTAGQTYSLTFYYANNPDGVSASARVSIAGLTANFTHAGSTSGNMNYTLGSYSFVATSASQLLTFQSTDPAGDYSGIVLDDVSVNLSAVPEPASVAMLGLGLVALGGFARARRRTV